MLNSRAWLQKYVPRIQEAQGAFEDEEDGIPMEERGAGDSLMKKRQSSAEPHEGTPLRAQQSEDREYGDATPLDLEGNDDWLELGETMLWSDDEETESAVSPGLNKFLRVGADGRELEDRSQDSSRYQNLDHIPDSHSADRACLRFCWPPKGRYYEVRVVCIN